MSSGLCLQLITEMELHKQCLSAAMLSIISNLNSFDFWDIFLFSRGEARKPANFCPYAFATALLLDLSSN